MKRQQKDNFKLSSPVGSESCTGGFGGPQTDTGSAWGCSLTRIELREQRYRAETLFRILLLKLSKALTPV